MQPQLNGAATQKLNEMIASHESILAQLKEFAGLAHLCDRLMDLNTQLVELKDRQDAVEVRLERLQKDHTEPTVVEALVRELDLYREDFLFKHGTQPYALELIALYDRLCELKVSFKEAPILTKDQASLNVEGLLTQVTQAITAVRLRIVTVKPGIDLNADWHEVVGTEVVDNPKQVGKVTRVVRPLFMYQGRPFRPAEVLVGVLHEPQEANNVSIREDAHSVGH